MIITKKVSTVSAAIIVFMISTHLFAVNVPFTQNVTVRSDRPNENFYIPQDCIYLSSTRAILGSFALPENLTTENLGKFVVQISNGVCGSDKKGFAQVKIYSLTSKFDQKNATWNIAMKIKGNLIATVQSISWDLPITVDLTSFIFEVLQNKRSNNGIMFMVSSGEKNINSYFSIGNGFYDYKKPNYWIEWKAPPTENAQIKVTPPELNFGDIMQHVNSIKLITVSNTGNTRLTGKIELNNSDRGFKILDNPYISVEAGKSLNLQIQFMHNAIGAYSSKLKITTNASNAPEVNITLKANCVNNIDDLISSEIKTANSNFEYLKTCIQVPNTNLLQQLLKTSPNGFDVSDVKFSLDALKCDDKSKKYELYRRLNLAMNKVAYLFGRNNKFGAKRMADDAADAVKRLLNTTMILIQQKADNQNTQNDLKLLDFVIDFHIYLLEILEKAINVNGPSSALKLSNIARFAHVGKIRGDQVAQLLNEELTPFISSIILKEHFCDYNLNNFNFISSMLGTCHYTGTYEDAVNQTIPDLASHSHDVQEYNNRWQVFSGLLTTLDWGQLLLGLSHAEKIATIKKYWLQVYLYSFSFTTMAGKIGTSIAYLRSSGIERIGDFPIQGIGSSECLRRTVRNSFLPR